MQVKGTCTVESKKGVLKDTCKIKRTRNRTETMNEGNVVISQYGDPYHIEYTWFMKRYCTLFTGMNL